MKVRWIAGGAVVVLSVALAWTAYAADAPPVSPPAAKPAEDAVPAALRKKAEASIDKALAFLHQSMEKDGSWRGNPGVTGLVLMAFLESPRGYTEKDGPFIRKPIEYLLKMQKENGAIYDKELANYCTAISIQALIAAKNPEYDAAIKKAHAYIVGSQLDESKGFDPKKDYGYGGWGYGGSLRPDLSNVQMDADALKAAEEAGFGKDVESWKKMVVFLSRCQNRSESNDQANVGDDLGAYYSPVESKAGQVTLPDGRKAWRSYGSMTYAFIKSMIYANVSKDDPRLAGAYKWIQQNYTLEENPGLGQDGLFYYYHTLAKALHAWGDDTLVDAKGVKHNWRADVIEKLLSLQREDGTWINAKDRWFEGDPVTVTGYVVLTLEEALAK